MQILGLVNSCNRVVEPVLARERFVCMKQEQQRRAVFINCLTYLKNQASICMTEASFAWPLCSSLRRIVRGDPAFNSPDFFNEDEIIAAIQEMVAVASDPLLARAAGRRRSVPGVH